VNLLEKQLSTVYFKDVRFPWVILYTLCKATIQYAYCIVALSKVYDQPDDGLEKGRNM